MSKNMWEINNNAVWYFEGDQMQMAICDDKFLKYLESNYEIFQTKDISNEYEHKHYSEEAQKVNERAFNNHCEGENYEK